MIFRSSTLVGLFGGALAPLLLAACDTTIAGPGVGSAGTEGSGAMTATGGTGVGGTGVGGTGAGGTGAGGSAGTPECTTAPPVGKTRVWRLTHTQVANTLRDSFGFVPPSIASIPIETRLDGFANQASKLTISELLAEAYFAIGAELGAHAKTNPGRFGITCDVAQLSPATCLNTFLTNAGRKMWRRPLTENEVSSLTGLFTATAAQGGPAEAVASVIQALLLSPNFLHRTELGTATTPGVVTELSDYEVASALSYLIWDSAPDDELLTLASESKLRDKTVLAAQAKRMYATREKAEPALYNYLQQWLYLEKLPTTAKDTVVFPMATAEVAADLNEELRLFMNSVLFDPSGDRDLRTLFTATYSFVNERTAPIYGLTGVTGTAMVRRDLDATQRRGIISMLPFLWGHSSSEETNLVGRGAYVRNHLLCAPVHLPPGGVPPGMFAPENATARQKLELHSTEACAGCHLLFDGIGFALENYDAIGRFRTTEHDQLIDPSGRIPLPSELDETGLEFSNFIELADQLVDKPDIYDCFARQFASYAVGREIAELDACEAKALAAEFAAKDHKIDELVMSVIMSPGFIQRQN